MNSMRVRLSAVILGVLVLALLFLSMQTAQRAQALLQPEIERKAATVADTVSSLVTRALELGIPFERLHGLDDHLQRIIDANPDLSFVALNAADGTSAYRSRSTRAADDAGETIAVPIRAVDGVERTLVVGLDPAFARQVVSTLWIDLVIVIFVTAVVALELIYVGFGIGLYGAIEGVEERLRRIGRGDLRQHLPVDGGSEFGRLAQAIDKRLDGVNVAYAAVRQMLAQRRDQITQQAADLLQSRFGFGERVLGPPARVIAVRAPLFVFMLAEELTRPFLPGYIKAMAGPVAGLSPEFVASLPMTAFLVVVAGAQPFLGSVTESLGRRRSLMIGALLGILGYGASAFADGLLGLTVARAVSGLGFAFVFVSAQGFVIDSTDLRQRSSGMAMFISAILVAGLCGPPIGGILADRMGIPGAFIVAGIFAAVSLALAWLCMPAQEQRKPAQAIRWRDFGSIVTSPALAALLFLCALPAKIILVAFCFFLVPLQMDAIGAMQSATGRMLMIYPVAMVLLVPTFASLADRWDMRASFVAGGGMLAGASAFVMLVAEPGVPAMAAMLLGQGLGQALSIAALSGLVGDFARRLPGSVNESSVYGIFRLVERSGNALGPLLAGTLLGLYGFAATVTVIGSGVAACALIFGVTMIARRTTALELPTAGG